MRQDAADDNTALAAHDRQNARSMEITPTEDGGTEEVDEVRRRLNEVRAAIRTIRILGQVLHNGATSIPADEKLSVMEEILGVGRRLLGFLFGNLGLLDGMITDIRDRCAGVVEEIWKEGNSGHTPPNEIERTKIETEATSFASRFCFDLHWFATYAMIKRMAGAIGTKQLDNTLAKVRSKDDSLPNHLVELATRLNRREKHIPSTEIVRLHDSLKRDQNKLARVVLEALTTDRLMLFETHFADKQQVCRQMQIQVPVNSFDTRRKVYRPKALPKGDQ
jgi:hypothetical protein